MNAALKQLQLLKSTGADAAEARDCFFFFFFFFPLLVVNLIF
jgi:hypothetical protein